uniref:Homing endonuclease n=1 Tax=Spizellomyces sp. 'palustris' TaxID=117820 RepID=UPI0010FBF401|nr:Homing endonuclease [Spizellomyces sp. 'palustris']QCQ69034.1 Homing endonuclease [Spizellomyces sp. 'palustris']
MVKEFHLDISRDNPLYGVPHDFLIWFIGFMEGDGSYFVSGGRVYFVIVQKEKAILEYIQRTLGFGNIFKHGNYWRLELGDPKVLHALLMLLNGNLVLGKRFHQLRVVIEAFNLRYLNLPIDFI